MNYVRSHDDIGLPLCEMRDVVEDLITGNVLNVKKEGIKLRAHQYVLLIFEESTFN